MSITRRGVLALAGGLAAGAGCTACSPGPGSASPSIGPSATATARPALSVWHRAEGADGVQQALLRCADAYPAAQVTLTSVEADYERVTAAALATASPPDVFEWTTGPTLDMIRAGQVVDLTDAVGDDASDFAPAVIERLTHQGRLWAVPQAVDVQLLYYRKSLLAKAGLQPPETLGQLTAAAKALTASGMGGLYAGSDRGLGALGGLLIGAAGLRQVSPDGRTPAFDEPALHDAADAFAALLNSPGVLRSASTEWTDAAPFIENECAMQWGGLWDLTRVLAAHAGDVGVLPFPAATPAGRQVVRLPAVALCAGLHGTRTPAYAVITYGNRAVEDALVELVDDLTQRGFVVIGAAAVVAQHTYTARLAPGRPTEQDAAALARRVGDAFAAGRPVASVPGERPYKAVPAGRRVTPAVTPACTRCGDCAAECPVEAIPPAAPDTTDLAACIGCGRCLIVCPEAARVWGGDHPAVRAWLESTFVAPLENAYYF